jgi:hypothetical protein
MIRTDKGKAFTGRAFIAPGPSGGIEHRLIAPRQAQPARQHR